MVRVLAAISNALFLVATFVLTALSARKSAHPFRHGAEHELGMLRLFDSYHCSRYNTNTGVLTPDMFRKVFGRVREYLDAA